MSVETPTNVLLVLRGHYMKDGVFDRNDVRLGLSSIERTHAAADYYNANKAAFSRDRQAGIGGIILASGGYPTYAAGHKIPPLPEELREGNLARDILLSRGVPSVFIKPVTTPRTTVECVLDAFKSPYFRNRNRRLQISPENPVVVDAHDSQMDRIISASMRITRLTEDSFRKLVVPGEDDPAIKKDELEILSLTEGINRWLPATDLAMRSVDRAMGFASRIAVATGLREAPGLKYLGRE